MSMQFRGAHSRDNRRCAAANVRKPAARPFAPVGMALIKTVYGDASASYDIVVISACADGGDKRKL